MNPAQKRTAEVIEQTLGRNPAYRKLADHLFIVKQGSTFVMINVVAMGAERAQVRCVAQLVKGVTMTQELAIELLQLNAKLRFGAFAYEPNGSLLLFIHSLLGGDTLDAVELTTSLADVALVADEYDEKIIAKHGGNTMKDLLQESALRQIFSDNDPDAFA